MNEKEISEFMKKLGYDKITSIVTKKKEQHKIEHKNIYFDNKKVPYRSVIQMRALKDLIKELVKDE